MPATITNVTYTINGQTKPLIPGTRFVVGQVVTFNAVLQGGGSLTVLKRVSDVNKGAVAWAGQTWTVGAADLPINRLRFNHRRNKTDQPDLFVDIVVAPSPIVATPTTGTPQRPRLTSRMKLGLVDASAQSLALTQPLVEPLKLYSLAPWPATSAGTRSTAKSAACSNWPQP